MLKIGQKVLVYEPPLGLTLGIVTENQSACGVRVQTDERVASNRLRSLFRVWPYAVEGIRKGCAEVEDLDRVRRKAHDRMR